MSVTPRTSAVQVDATAQGASALRPVVMTIAGSDSSGGAGIQADLKTFTALGVYGASVITALTAQNTLGVSGVLQVPAEFVAQQFEAVVSDLEPVVVKVGMLANAQVAATVAGCLGAHAIPTVVVDPVMVATSGDRLLDEDAIEVLKTRLFRLATLITPNRAEAALLTGMAPFQTLHEMEMQAKCLLEFGCGAVLIKGGHGDTAGETASDVLVSERGVETFERPRLETVNTHGTGCTLSSAIAAYLARGMVLAEAVEAGKAFVWRALDGARNGKIGRGSGPLDHMFGRE